jgi:hypothetical protein
MKHSVIATTFLALVFFNILFLLLIFLNFFPSIANVAQWVLAIANFILLTVGITFVERKSPEHHSPHELTIFQMLFSICITATIVILLLMLIMQPIPFLIFMPFEFFLLAFYMGFYFFLTRHIFPIRPKI